MCGSRPLARDDESGDRKVRAVRGVAKLRGGTRSRWQAGAYQRDQVPAGGEPHRLVVGDDPLKSGLLRERWGG